MLRPWTIARRTTFALGITLYLASGPLVAQERAPEKSDDLPQNFDDLPQNFDDLPQNFDDLPQNFVDFEAGTISSDYLRRMIPETYRTVGLDLPTGALDKIVQAYARQPGAEIVMFDHQTGRAIPGQLTGRVSHVVGDDIDGRRACGSPCSQLGSGRTLKLDRIRGNVTMAGIGDARVRRSGDSRSIGFIDPNSGQAWVQWPVTLEIPESRLLGSDFTDDAVLKGFGRVSRAGNFMVVSVARITTPEGRVMDVTNVSCSGTGDGCSS